MEQATAPTTDTEPRVDSFEHAHAVAGDVVTRLDQKPYAVHVEEDWPAGWRVHLWFRTVESTGLFDLAAALDVPVTKATIEAGVHLEVYTRVQDVEVRGTALVDQAQAAKLEGLPVPGEEQPPLQPVPLGASVLAQVPAIEPVDSERPDSEGLAVAADARPAAECAGGEQ